MIYIDSVDVVMSKSDFPNIESISSSERESFTSKASAKASRASSEIVSHELSLDE